MMESEQLENEGPRLILPMVWHERMDGLSGKSQTAARHILRLLWEGRGQPVRLANGPLLAKGIGHHAKRCALEALERRGLIDVERRPGQVFVVRIPSRWMTARKVYDVPWKVIRDEYDLWWSGGPPRRLR
jgi:hypothetical protein